MKSPKQYTIKKITLKQLIKNDYNLEISHKEKNKYEIKQADNMLFRQIRLITNNYNNHNNFVIFVDCKGWKSHEDKLRYILKNGFILNNIHFVASEKSGSMSRNSVMAFVDESIYIELDKRISMDMEIEHTVLAKLLAYRGLMFSGCFCIENWIPNIVVVEDYSKIIPNQHIKYLVDIEKDCINKDGEPYIWKEKGIETGYHDVTINLWDGSGIHSPEITKYIQETIKTEETPTSILWRFPYAKGMTHEIDFKTWFKENGRDSITDVFGQTHLIEGVDIIITKSFYKGFKYFYKYGDYRDWDLYWDKFKQYNHCIGVATWNYSFENEPQMKKTSYQILQDLNLEFDDFLELTNYTTEWVDKIVNGDLVYTNCFLGLFADKQKASNDYMKAVLKNQEMLKEPCVRGYFNTLLKKNIDLMKCGKLYVDGSFKFVVSDLIMFLEHISKMDMNGVLKENEFYSIDMNGVVLGDRVIERNPHISQEEHLILKGTDNDLLKKYCSHLSNICMLNGYSLSFPRLNGADEDGDRIFQIDNDVIKKGIIKDLPIVIDIEDKITAKEEEINQENIVECNIRSMTSLVGEISNFATCYHNKTPKSDEQKNKYLEYINILSICNGKSIDFAKTGIIFNVPRHISKYAKPLPYFMKFTSPYYMNLNNFSKAYSNMNRMCFKIEKWAKQIKYKHKFKDFDYKIMIDDSIEFNESKFNQIHDLYLTYEKEMSELRKQSAMKNNSDNYSNYFGDSSKIEIINSHINWGFYYEPFKEKAKEICPNIKELANYTVKICYELYPKKNKKFAWIVSGEGIIKNIKQEKIILPIEDENGQYEYLGRTYNLKEVNFIAE